jgi:tRNA A-37 threonylcarbamoyl transferase component Bud32
MSFESDVSPVGGPVIDPRLLASAATQLGVESGRMIPMNPVERDRSVVTALTIGSSIVAWHKQTRYGDELPGMLDEVTARARLALAESCTRAIIDVFASDSADLTLAPVLAIDLDTLCVITGHVDGAPVRIPMTGFSRYPVVRANELRLTGRCLALIDVSLPVVENADPTGAETRIRVPFELLRSNYDQLGLRGLNVAWLGKRIDVATSLVEEAGYKASLAHGDVSTTNVRLARNRVGLIDADWPCRLTGFDLATLSVRLELAAARAPRVGRWMTAQLLEGYREVTPVGPGFHFERTQRFLRLLATGMLQSRASRRVAIKYLGLDHPLSDSGPSIG